jgi:para-nitrobenzyl esterase
MRITPILLVTCLSVGPALADTDPTLVQTPAGWVRGTSSADARTWEGIPYALPPTGQRRWKPPEPVSSLLEWEERVDDEDVFLATGRGFACSQISWRFVEEEDRWEQFVEGSEDCLYLNVTAPPDAGGEGPLPVYVHIHGGGNFGGSAEPDARGLVRHGVIVVTLNYRLGAFGMLAHPALSAEGHGANFHLLDQIAALAWVRDNIAGFGGDPGNVTLGGFSAGAGDVVALLAVPQARGLFHRAAPHAIGNYWITGFDSSLAQREGIGEQVAASVGCAGVPDVAACLRGLPTADLVWAMGNNDWGATTDGVLLTEPVLAQIQRNGGTVPLLIGHNREEDSWAVFGQEPLSWSSYVHLANDLVGAQLGQTVRALYPESDYDGSFYWAMVALTTDAAHGCPVRRVANATRNATYRYLYTHVLERYDWAQSARAYHGAEHEMLWYADLVDLTDSERTLAERMRRYWTNFMKSGNPNDPEDPGPVEWPEYDLENENLLVLDTQISVVSQYRVDECAVIDTTPLGPSCNTAFCRYYSNRFDPSGGYHPVFGWFFPLIR